jgi:hypothetical protein
MKNDPYKRFKGRKLEAASRFELEVKVLQTSALPLGYAAPKGRKRTKKRLQRKNGVSPNNTGETLLFGARDGT